MIKTLGAVGMLCLGVSAFADNLICTAHLNMEALFEHKVTVAKEGSAGFGEYQGLRFTVTNKGASKYEVQVFDPAVPARHYAEGTLKTADDEVKWTFWGEDALVDASCKLAP